MFLPPLAHVKWFIDYNMDSSNPEPIYGFSLHNPAIIIWLTIILTLILLAFAIDRMFKSPPKSFIKFANENKSKILHLFQICVGISLLFASHQGTILQPHYNDTNTIGTILKIIESSVGILLIADIAVPFAAIMLLFTYLSIFYLFSFTEAIDYINLIGISIFLFVCGNKNQKKYDFQKVALPILRIFTGLALFILAFSEKLLFPERAYELLEHYQLNFMKMIGFHHYTDQLFTLSAGAVEAAFGIILILGLTTRINVIALTGFFLASNLFFFTQGYINEGIVELMGHLPVIATAIILITYGSGKFSLTKQGSKD